MLRRPPLTTAPPVVIRRKISKPASAKPGAEKPSTPTAAVTKPPSANGAKTPALAKSEAVKPPPAKPPPAKQSPPVPPAPVPSITASVLTAGAVPDPATGPSVPDKKEREREEAYQLLCRLSEKFPVVFARNRDQQVQPLEIGIRQKLVSLLPEENAKLVGKAIGLYTALVRFEYLSAIIEGQSRVDLAGNLGAVPTEEEREAARKQLAAWQEKRLARKKLRVPPASTLDVSH
jgi:RNA chaperone ProQ/FINO-like protein